MDIWAPKLHPAAWTVMSLLCVYSHEVTVWDFNLKPCKEDKRVCVTDHKHCGPRPPASIQKTLNMSCWYNQSQRSMTCEWSRESNSHTEPDVSLIISSEDPILFCPSIFGPLALLNVTARIQNYMMGTLIWSQPHTVDFSTAVKPPRPSLDVLVSTEDSVVVSWTSSGDGDCRLRYRVDDTLTWTQAPDLVPAHRGQTLTYRIRDLQTFTVYRAALACREEAGVWSDWSSEVSVRTLDRVPSRPPEVCYRVEKSDPAGPLLLYLMWKDLDVREAGGHILGYQVSCEPVKKKQDRWNQTVTEVGALLEVEEGNYSVTVSAFNTAGHGPAAQLSIDTQRHNILPSIKHLWVSSSFPATKGLLVQWESPTVPPSDPPVSHLAVQWHPETRPSTSRWTTVDNVTSSTVIQLNDDDPEDESYLISVTPVYNQRCGAPQSLPAALQHGALMEAVRLKVVGVTKTSVTVAWAWQRRAGPIRVERYSVRLRRDSEEKNLSLWPDQRQHTFFNLEPNTEYSLLLLADDVSRSIVSVRTDFDEVPAVVAATPLLLLAVTVFIISVLSRTLYKSYFFPPISSPRGSKTGQWLMDPNHQKSGKTNILDMEDFEVTDVLGEKSLITVGPDSRPSSEEDLSEDASLLSINHLIKLQLDPQFTSEAPVFTEGPLVSLQSYHTDYLVNCRHPDLGFFSEERRDADGRVDSPETSRQRETAVKYHFLELMANSQSVYQMSCEAEYVANSSFLGKTDVA